MEFNINTNAVVKFTLKLEKLKKSALPNAIRGTLNDAAFDVKTVTMPKFVGTDFKKRQPNFFKANSKFDKAVGFNVNSMQSEVGFYENKLQNASTNYAVKDLQQQEVGGNIDGRSFIPMKAARMGGKGKVRANARLADIKKNIISATKSNVGNRFRKQKFIRAAIVAKTLNPSNAFVLGNKTNGSQTLFRVDELHTGTRGQGNFGSRKLFIKLVPLYRVKKDRVVNVNAKHFMKRASLGTALKLDSFYIKQAQRQIAKLK